MIKKNAVNKHHIIQKCERARFNIEDRRNIKRMLVIQHDALHQLFRNLTTPKDQLNKLKELYEPILSELSKSLFDQLLEIEDEEFYAEGIVR